MRPMAGHEQAQSKIRRKLTAFFRKNKHAIVAAALRHHDLAKADDGSPDYVDDSADWSVVVPLMPVTVVPLAMPPAETLSAPLLPGLPTSVLSTSVPIARPPEETLRMAALDRTAPDAVPPLDTTSIAE